MALRNLYNQMSTTTESVTPAVFLAALRHAFPQFAEMSRASGMKALIGGGGYAQQGASSLPHAYYIAGRDSWESCRCEVLKTGLSSTDSMRYSQKKISGGSLHIFTALST